MKTHIRWVVMGVTLALGTNSQALAQQPRNNAVEPSPAPVVSKTIDAKTGLEIRQELIPTGGFDVRVASGNLSVRKAARPGLSQLELRDDAERVSILADADGVTVKGLGPDRRVDRSNAASFRQVQTVLSRSRVVAKARALLGRMDLKPTTLSGNALLLTRVLLATMVGDEPTVEMVRAEVRSLPKTPRLVQVRRDADLAGPGACWDKYVAYLDQIWDDFVACVNKVGVGSMWSYACSFEWELRAEMAMAWLISCNGGLPVK